MLTILGGFAPGTSQEILLFGEDDCHRITVRCHHVLDDALNTFRKGFDFESNLDDAGGPCREFFCLLRQGIFSSSFFF